MASKKAYQRGRHFKLTGAEVIELIFADESDEDVCDLDADDIEFLESAVDENVETAIIHTDQTDGTFVTGDDSELSESTDERPSTVVSHVYTASDAHKSNRATRSKGAAGLKLSGSSAVLGRHKSCRSTRAKG